MMIWQPTAYSFTGITAAALAWAMAAFVLRAAPGQELAKRFALLLVVEGAVVASSHAGIPLFIGSARVAYVVALLHVVFDALLIALYLPMLARALNTRLLDVFRSRPVELALFAVPAAAAIAAVLFPEGFVRGFGPATDGYFRWMYVPGPLWNVLGVPLIGMFVFGLVAAIASWRQAATPAVRRRARAFAAAFGVRDVFWAGVYLVALTQEADVGMRIAGLVLQAYAISLIAYVLLSGYGILTAQLFDIDLRIKWTLQQGTVAGAFIAVFFLVSEAAATFLSDRLGSVLGLLAAALLVFLLAPLQRAAERLADSAMPNTRQTPEYEAFRKLQIYAAALEGAFQDGEVTERERGMLRRLQQTLGVHDADALRLEQDVRAAAAAEPGATVRGTA